MPPRGTVALPRHSGNPPRCAEYAPTRTCSENEPLMKGTSKRSRRGKGH